MSGKTLNNEGDTYEPHSLYDRWLHIRLMLALAPGG